MAKLFGYEALWEYQSASNSVPADPSLEAVPVADWLGPSAAPFGTIGSYVTDRGINTVWALDTGLWIRRNIELDGRAPLLLTGDIENACYIYFDGDYVASINPSGANRINGTLWSVIIPQDLATEGTHEIALLCQDEGSLGEGDTTYIYVEAEYLPALFPFWPRAPLREDLEWLTDTIISEDGSEDRGQLRVNPRQSMAMSFYIPPGYQQLAANTVYGARSRQWLVPFWPHVQRLGAVASGLFELAAPTDNVHLRDQSMVLLWQSPERFQVLGLDVVESGNLVLTQPTEAFDDAHLIPLRRGYLARTPERRFTGAKSDFQLSFTMEDNYTLTVSAPAQYLGADIYYDVGLLEGDRLSESMLARIDLHDEELGRVSYSSPWLFNRPARVHRMVGDGLEEAWAIREWLHRRAGRYRAFWQPTFEADLRVTSSGALTTTLSVRSDEYIRHASARSHIAVETAAGWLPREVTDVLQVSDTVVQLTLDTSLAIDAEDILRVSFLALRRLDTDRVELDWVGGQVCAVSVNTVEVEP